jgi:hypothetical protein
MGSPDRHSLRIVIQQIRFAHASFYRLVAYGNQKTYRPAEFETFDQLSKALHATVPALNGNLPSSRTQTEGTSILFSGAIELDDAQLARLGLSCQES